MGRRGVGVGGGEDGREVRAEEIDGAADSAYWKNVGNVKLVIFDPSGSVVI